MFKKAHVAVASRGPNNNNVETRLSIWLLKHLCPTICHCDTSTSGSASLIRGTVTWFDITLR